MLNSMGMGGIENFVMNVYRNIDRNKYQFDFILQNNEKSFFEEEIEKLGGKVYKIPRFEKAPIKHIKELKRILSENDYAAFHRHTANSVAFVDLMIAKKCKMDVRIAHSHNTSHNAIVLNNIFKPLLYKYATKHLACGKDAGRWLFGNRDFTTLYNGIDIKKYSFSNDIRQQYREEFKVADNEVLLGNVGRFSEQKNHKYLIEIFSALSKKDDKYKLVLCGDGELREDIEKQIKENNIEDKVILAGVRKDVNCILQAMDIFVFPSLYEGLPVTLMEAQISNIPMIISNTITEEVKYNNITSIGIEENDIEKWCEEIQKCKLETDENRKKINQKIIDDYDVNKIIQKLCDIYES